MNQVMTRKWARDRENTMNPDTALVEMKKMFDELKLDLNSELKSEMKSLRDEIKQEFGRLEGMVTSLNKTRQQTRGSR